MRGRVRGSWHEIILAFVVVSPGRRPGIVVRGAGPDWIRARGCGGDRRECGPERKGAGRSGDKKGTKSRSGHGMDHKVYMVHRQGRICRQGEIADRRDGTW